MLIKKHDFQDKIVIKVQWKSHTYVKAKKKKMYDRSKKIIIIIKKRVGRVGGNGYTSLAFSAIFEKNDQLLYEVLVFI